MEHGGNKVLLHNKEQVPWLVLKGVRLLTVNRKCLTVQYVNCGNLSGTEEYFEWLEEHVFACQANHEGS